MKQREAQHFERRSFERYVAIGDSSTEGLEDPYVDGGYRGWADRLALHLAEAQGCVDYANLAVRGRRTRRILEEQLEPALALRPSLCSLFSGTNDVVARHFDGDAVAADLERMQRALVGAGATVLTFTLPDLSEVMPLGRLLAQRVESLNRSLREICGRTGALLVDLAAYPVAADSRLWNADRLHANSAGHERIAAALAHALDLPGRDDSWKLPLESRPRAGIARRVAAEATWIRRFLLPWAWRHARGISSGDGRSAKYPELRPIRALEYPASRPSARSL